MHRFVLIFLANIFLSLHYATILYVNSTFLGEFFSRSSVSLLFLGGAVLNIGLFFLVGRLVRKYGIKAVYTIFILVTALSVLSLGLASTALQAGLSFLIYAGSVFFIYFSLDVFLEDVSDEHKTGGTRGLYLTLSSAAIASGPLLLALIVDGDALRPAYFASAGLLLVPLVIGIFLKLKKAPHEHLKSVHHTGSLPFGAWWRSRGPRSATLSRLALEIFYALMTIYTPLYLYSELGFGWDELGIMFTIMLLPFIIFEWPMGVLADKKLGEKEIMTFGFFTIGVALIIMPFLSSTWLLWTAVLFLSRIGASFVEVTTESHFFKHVDSRDSGLISIFRLSRPSGIIIATVLGAISFQLFSFEKIFFVVAVVAFLGLRESLYMRDTI